MKPRIEKLDVPLSVLGEGPLWSDRDQCLYFVDIIARRVQAYWPKSRTYKYWQFEKFTGSLAECKSGGLIVALIDEIVWFDPRRGLKSLEVITGVEQDRPLNRLNDGKADPWGRFWVGSVQMDEADSTGRLWCLTPEGELTAVRDGIGVSNSIAFDRDRKRMYFADSHAGKIECASVDAKQLPTRWETFATLERGGPDGSCTDADGYLWNAQWGAWQLVRYTPDGAVDRVFEMPVSRPSCCTFGGKGYKTLFVTSARFNMNAEEKKADLSAGALYSVEFEDVRGEPADLFGR